MAGLLDNGYTPDPLAMGLLGMGSALMTPRAMGGGVGAGMNAFAQQAMAAQQMRRAMAQDELRQQLFSAQMDNYRSEAEQRKATAEERRRATELARTQAEGQRRVLDSFAGPQPGFRDASIAMTGNAPAGYMPPEQRGGQITREIAAAWVANGGDLSTLQKLAESPNFGRPEVARVLERRGADGTPEQVREDRYGGTIGAAVPKPFEMRMQDIGGSVVPVNPFSPTSLAKTLTPGDIQQSRDSAASRAVTMRGQDLTEARERINGGIKAPAGYRFKPDGSLEFIAGGPADPAADRGKPATEAQSKDYLFATRAAASHRIVEDLGKKPSVYGAATTANLSNVPLIGGAIGAVSNATMLSPETQQYMQAKRDFINAVLRKESGAVIGMDEFKSADLQYFPQPGDGEAVIRQKAAGRQRAIDGIAAGAGPLARNIQTGGGAGGSGQSITDLLRKYGNAR